MRTVATITTPAFLLFGVPHVASAQAAAPNASRLLLGDAALEIRSSEDGKLQVALADSLRVLAITVLARDAKRWADSVSLVLRVKTSPKGRSKEWIVLLEEPGIHAGSFSLTRRDGDGRSQFSLFLADREFEEIRISLDATEVRALVAAMRRRVSEAGPLAGDAPQRRTRPRPLVTKRKPTTLPQGA